MTICSYLVYPTPGSMNEMITSLNQVPGSSAYPAEKGEVAILVTEAEDQAANRKLRERVEGITTVCGLAMVFGQTEYSV